jgi:hypothetical protein
MSFSRTLDQDAFGRIELFLHRKYTIVSYGTFEEALAVFLVPVIWLVHCMKARDGEESDFR